MTNDFHVHGPHCTCLTRRRAFNLTLAGMAGLAIAGPARAGGHAEAVVLNCMDYRLVDEGVRYFNARGLRNNYDQLILAGGSIGALGKLGPEWSATFWKHVETAIALHKVKKLIVMDHRDCGAYKLVFGADSIAERDVETALHRSQMITLRQEVQGRFPSLAFEAAMMNLDGSVDNLFPGEGHMVDYKPRPKPKPKPAEPHAAVQAHADPAAAAPKPDTLPVQPAQHTPPPAAHQSANIPIETAAPPKPAAPASHAPAAHAPAHHAPAAHAPAHHAPAAHAPAHHAPAAHAPAAIGSPSGGHGH